MSTDPNLLRHIFDALSIMVAIYYWLKFVCLMPGLNTYNMPPRNTLFQGSRFDPGLSGETFHRIGLFPFTFYRILNHLYGGMDEPELKIIDVFICKLRKKLQEALGYDSPIETVWGRGYVLRDPQPVEQERIAVRG